MTTNNYSTIFIIMCLIVYWIYLYKKMNIENFENVSRTIDSTELPYHIWMYWENKPNKTKPIYLDMCYKTIKKNCPNFKVHLLDENTVHKFLPDMRPDLNSKLERIPMKTDYIRYNLLYHYGGIWLDSDIIVFKDLSDIVKKLQEYEYVGFGCHGGDKKCEASMNGYPKPSNWVMISRKHSVLLKHCIDRADKLLDTNDNSYFNTHYHIIGRNLIWECIQEIKSKNKHWDYLHMSSKCIERDSNGRKYTNKVNMTMEDVDEYCKENKYFMPIYNTAPGFPKWFLDLSEAEILNSTLLLSKHFKQALGV